MHKVFLKPTSYEVIIKGNPKDSHTDVFTYDYYDDDIKRKLGGLFIVGNVKQDETGTNDESIPNSSPDIAYVTNLVASLAKREYYSNLDIAPRDAFVATLKKINDVVEEFFKNKALKVNIGIFAIAGEKIFISKLGKFKIILARPARNDAHSIAGGVSRAVDILNNVDLFNKEQVEEKEFSNIISGKMMPGDRLFAFYPSRMVIAREKFIKTNLLKFDDEKFVEKINSIKEIKPDFDCGALYLSLNRHKEPAIVKEVRPVVPKSNKSVEDNYVTLAKTELDDQPESTEFLDRLKHGQETTPRINKNNGDAPKDLKDNTPVDTPAKQEVPRIIPSEFSLGKKNNPLLTPIKILKNIYNGSGSYIGGLAGHRLSQNINLKRKFVILSMVAGVLIVGIVVVKKFVIIDPEQRQLNTVINQTQNNLKLVRTKIDQSDFIGARQLLMESLASIYAVGIKNDRTNRTTGEIYEVLDNIDNAVDVSPSLLETMPEDLEQEISILNTQKEIREGVAFDTYENNLYILTSDSILKVLDIDQDNKEEATLWLKSGVLPSQSSMIAVDGNIYVMNKSGTLVTYYKGEKISETNTFIVSSDNDVLLTSRDSDKLYLVNKSLGRIYELDKESISLIRTLKVGSSEPFVDAYLYEDPPEAGRQTIIIITKDNRIWEIK